MPTLADKAAIGQMAGKLIEITDVRRLLMAHISEFQKDRISRGEVPSHVALERVVLGLSETSQNEVQIDENTLAIDSLALLDLVMKVTQFFNLQDSGVEDYLLVQRSLGEWISLINFHFEQIGDKASITFKTSGTSGDAKSVTKSTEVLTHEINAIAVHLDEMKMRPKRLVSCVAPHHIYGFLWSVLLPKFCSVSVVDLYKASPFSVAKQCTSGDLILGTPFTWEQLQLAKTELPKQCFGVSSGGPTSDTTWQVFAEIGLDGVVEVFGSTETGGLGCRSRQDGPFELFAHLQSCATGGIRTADGMELNLQDAIVWNGPRAFSPSGRLDDVVQVAGTNVSVGAVREAMERVEGVKDLALRFDGDRLKAFVVASSLDNAKLEANLHAVLRNLPAVARPKEIAFGATLPRTDNGKLRAW